MYIRRVWGGGGIRGKLANREHDCAGLLGIANVSQSSKALGKELRDARQEAAFKGVGEGLINR